MNLINHEKIDNEQLKSEEQSISLGKTIKCLRL